MSSSKPALGALLLVLLSRRRPPRTCVRSRSSGNAASRSSKRAAIVTSATIGPSSRRAKHRPRCRSDPEPRDDRRELRRERIDRAIVGATIGGAVGSILRGGRRDSPSACSPARRQGLRSAPRRRAAAAVATRPTRTREGESDYLRALTACLEGRGYAVALPTAADLTVNR